MPTEHPSSTSNRRAFLGDISRTAAAASLGSLVAGSGLQNAHAAGGDEIRVAVIGCGGRGTGATVDALTVPGAALKVVALADVFPERLSIKKQSLAAEFPERIDVPEERSFIGFEAYKQAIDCLRPGDIALFATPPAFLATPLRLRDREGRPRLYGKADRRRRRQREADDRVGRAGRCETAQGGCGADVPPLRPSAGTPRPAPGGRGGGTRGLPRLSQPCAGPPDGSLSWPWRAARVALAGAPVPQLPLGVRRHLQRLLHPSHRRSLLDEKCLAGEG